jgi:organic radical activating enzyme
MTQENTKPDTVTVQAYSFADALTNLQDYVKQGYKVDVETNGTYPMIIGSLMLFTVVKDSTLQEPAKEPAKEPEKEPAKEPDTESEAIAELLEDVQETVQELTQAVEAQTAKRGRPKQA